MANDIPGLPPAGARALKEVALRRNLQQYGRAFLAEVAQAAVKYHTILRAPTIEELATGKIRPENLVVDHVQTTEDIELWLCRTFLTTPLSVIPLLAPRSNS